MITLLVITDSTGTSSGVCNLSSTLPARFVEMLEALGPLRKSRSVTIPTNTAFLLNRQLVDAMLFE